MNPNQLLDFALGQLESPDREQVERAIATDPVVADNAERLSRAIGRLLDDGDVFMPPRGLAERTLRLVEAKRHQRRGILDYVPRTVPFRWADVAVAAGIFLAGILTLLPAVQKSRDRMDQAGCGYNLQQLGRALWQYGSLHQHYPFGPEENPGAPAGAFVAMLHDGGLISDQDLKELDCPNSGNIRQHQPLPDFQTLCRIHSVDPRRAQDYICMDYAYNVGYRHPSGKVMPIAAVHSATVPLLADQPPHENYRLIHAGNSPNHGGRGQNVLYSDLHIGWHSSRRISPTDDDMYLNARNELRPGLDADDNVLLPSLVPFLGW